MAVGVDSDLPRRRVDSVVLVLKDYAIHSTYREIAVYPYSHKDGAFSTPGDSGSVVGDTNYGIIGMVLARPTQVMSYICRHTPSSTSVSSRPSNCNCAVDTERIK